MPVWRRLRPGWCMVVASAGALLTAGCGSGTGSTPTPLALSQLQSRYLTAASAYNSAEVTIVQAENAACGGATASLSACQAALQEDRKTTLAFDKALRAIPFPAAYRAAVAKLLQDDAQLEQTLQQAASGTSLSADQPLFLRLSSLFVTATQDAAALRTSLALPATSAPASATPPGA